MRINNIHKYSDEDLAVEYARLCLGPFEIKAPPYGSLYLDGERRVMGDYTMDVIRCYEDAGLSGSEDCRDLPDHIAVELEFMSYLIYKETEALERSDFVTALEMIKKQERFLDRFLGRWIVQFCEKSRNPLITDFMPPSQAVLCLLSGVIIPTIYGKRSVSRFSVRHDE